MPARETSSESRKKLGNYFGCQEEGYFKIHRGIFFVGKLVASLRSKRFRANEVLCVARVKIVDARKLGREQKRKRSREGVGQ